MDCGVSIALLVVLLTVLTAIWFKNRQSLMSTFRRLAIPGPPPNFILGNLRELEKSGNVVALKNWTKKYGKVFGYYMGGHRFLVISDAEICKQVQIKDFHSFSDRPELIKGGIFQNKNLNKHVASETGDRWKEQRAILTPTFTTGKLKRMMPLMEDCIKIMMGKIEQEAKTGTAFDIYDMYKGLTLDVIGRTAFGIQTNVQTNQNDPFLLSAKELLREKFTGLLLLSICLPEIQFVLYPIRRFINFVTSLIMENRINQFVDSCTSVVKARRSDPTNRRDDLLQLMLDAEITRQDIQNASLTHLTAGYESEATHVTFASTPSSSKGKSRSVYYMNDNEILSNTFVIFFAGYETTSTSLAYITHILVNDLVLQEKLRQEIIEVIAKAGSLDYTCVSQMKLMDQVISETLRYYPPVTTFVNRISVTDTVIGDLTIPKGVFVQVPVPILHRDPEYWTDPNTFDHERFAPENRSKITPTAYQAFGSGPRNCIGMRFAQIEIKLALARLLKDYKIVPCDSTEKGDIEILYKVAVMAPKNGVKVKAVKI